MPYFRNIPLSYNATKHAVKKIRALASIVRLFMLSFLNNNLKNFSNPVKKKKEKKDLTSM